MNQDATASPLFGRVLLNPDPRSTNIVLEVVDVDPARLLPRLEAVVENHDGPELGVALSGVPIIVERIRLSLFRDLVVFSSVAVGLFTLIVLLVYRDPGVLAGTLVTATTTVGATLLSTKLLGIAIGLLTANIITIVFVLTLSHIVFLTGNWSRRAREAEEGTDPTPRGVADTLEGSFWSMTTTLLGFLSLLLASAKPLRELGLAGAIGTATAFVATYLVYPAFLAHWARTRPRRTPTSPTVGPGSTTAKPVLISATLVVLVVGLGVPRVDTDPGLLSYFAPGSPIRDGLDQIDEDGGSSTLKIAVADPGGGRIDSAPALEAMDSFQVLLEADPAVGVVLSPSVLIGHARTQPLARFLTPAILLDIASSPELDEVALSYVTPDRSEGLFSLRMRESVDEPSRQGVMDRIEGYAGQAGLEPVLMGGFYDLQAQLGRLIASSLRIGLGGLLTLFLVIAWIVSRSARTTTAMFACLVGIPLVVLGVFGWTGAAVDIITSPAANVALAMGVDSMIHLVVRVRRIHRAGEGAGSAWSLAQRQIGPPVIAATLIICAGFGIFALSSFPPTRRFGFAVILGTMTAATMALLTLPSVASLWTGVEKPEPEPAQ